MKNKILCTIMILLALAAGSCKKDLLDQDDPNRLISNSYFANDKDATTALMGVYLANRTAFYKQYAFDGGSDMMYSKIAARPYSNYAPGSTMGSSMGRHWNELYRSINRANYVITNVDIMLGKGLGTEATLNRIKGEASFLRALAYFRLIDLWGDVPLYTNILDGNDEAYSLSRSPKALVRDRILADLDFAALNIPITISGSDIGRATRVAAFAYRGKVKLYWACWAKAAGNAGEAQTYYQGAAADFAEAMKPAYSRSLFRGGVPGTLTNSSYAAMFDGVQANENEMYATEAIFSLTNGGPSFGASDGQSDEVYGDTYLYDFGGRASAAGGFNVQPTLRLADRYQLLSTGGFAAPLVPTLNTAAGARTNPNSTLNPASYAGRDFRCRATIMWDDEQLIAMDPNGNLDLTTFPNNGIATYRFGQNGGTVGGLQYMNSDGQVTGYVYRKYIRQTVFGYSREAGPQDAWLMRLPDVWLMYCEAVNEVSGPTAECYDLIDKIRIRAGLPVLNRASFATKATFFDAIEQERIVELAGEGHRFFDIRRWHKAEQVWPVGTGYTLKTTWGNVNARLEFVNAVDKDYQRFYIFQIPPTEITNNPKITQNDPWF